MMRSSLGQLRLGLEGSLSMSEPMERLAAALLANCVPDSWRAWSFPSRRSLAGWNADLRRRIDASARNPRSTQSAQISGFRAINRSFICDMVGSRTEQ